MTGSPIRRAPIALAVLLAAALVWPGPARADFDASLAQAMDNLGDFFAADDWSREAEDDLIANLEALVAAGEADGLSFADIRRHATYVAMKRFGRDVPAALATERGYLDMDLLLVGATGRQLGEGGIDDYLSAISAEGAATRTTAEPEAAAQDGPTVTAAAAPEPAADASDDLPGRLYRRDGVVYLRVEPGDTLSRLAVEIYGTPLAYRRLYIANREAITNPNLLTPGIEFVVPWG